MSKKTLIISLSIVFTFLIVLLGVYLYGYWEIDVDEDNIEEIGLNYMTEVYSYDYLIEGVYVNDFIEDHYSDQLSHNFYMGERLTLIFGVDDMGNEILLIKTWRVFSKNYVIELDSYYSYDDAIEYIQTIYDDVDETDISMVITPDNDSITGDAYIYIGYLVNHGDYYTRFIFYDNQIVEIDGEVTW